MTDYFDRVNDDICVTVQIESTRSVENVDAIAAVEGVDALFIGPSQSSARALLLQMVKDGREGVAFGLYTMTGRAVAFAAPWLFSVFVDGFGAVRAGLGGIALVLIAGLLAMLAVRVPPRHSVAVEQT